MSTQTVQPSQIRARGHRLDLKALVGAGDCIGAMMLPFVVAGLALNFLRPSAFNVGGPHPALQALSIALLIPGVTIWLWSVVLIVTKVPGGELITSGPFRLVKHPLYTGVALLVLPWVGFLLDSWLGAVLGVILYGGSRLFAPREEAALAATFGEKWSAYARGVKVPWL